MTERKSTRTKQVARRVALLLCLAVFVVSGGMLARYWWAARQTQESVGVLKEVLAKASAAQQKKYEGGVELPEAEVPGFDELHERNGDFAGWISIEGTSVDYPVMLPPSSSPEYYLRRNFEKSYDINGIPFLDSRCKLDPVSGVLIVYGHNMHSGVMFHDLLSYRKQSFWEAHRYVRLDTLAGQGVYEIAAAFLYDAASDEDAFKPHRYVDFSDEAAFNAYVAQVRAAAYYDTGVELEYGDRLLVLATCDRTLLQSGRMILVAKQVPDPMEGD